MITHITISYFEEGGQLKRTKMFKVNDLPVAGEKVNSDFYIKVDGYSGQCHVLKEAELCQMCGGTGGTRYCYEQDHSVFAACPVCRGGDLKQWNKAASDWENCR